MGAGEVASWPLVAGVSAMPSVDSGLSAFKEDWRVLAAGADGEGGHLIPDDDHGLSLLRDHFSRAWEPPAPVQTEGPQATGVMNG